MRPQSQAVGRALARTMNRALPELRGVASDGLPVSAPLYSHVSPGLESKRTTFPRLPATNAQGGMRSSQQGPAGQDLEAEGRQPGAHPSARLAPQVHGHGDSEVCAAAGQRPVARSGQSRGKRVVTSRPWLAGIAVVPNSADLVPASASCPRETCSCLGRSVLHCARVHSGDPARTYHFTCLTILDTPDALY